MEANKKFIPSASQLQQDVTAIFIDADMNYDWARERIIWHLDPTEPDNMPDLTYELLLSRYRSHIEHWNRRFKSTEERGYLSKPDAAKRKNFTDFLENRLYKIDWGGMSMTPGRDLYLFGDIAQSKLSQQRKIFIEGLKL